MGIAEPELTYEARYFAAHARHWIELQGQADAVHAAAVGAKAPDGALWTTLVPGFKQAYDAVCDLIAESMLGKAAAAFGDMADRLDHAGELYVEVEAANVAEAVRIERAVGL